MRRVRSRKGAGSRVSKGLALLLAGCCVVMTYPVLIRAPLVAAQGSVEVVGPSTVNECDVATYNITFVNTSDERKYCGISVNNTMPSEGFSYVAGSTNITLHDGTQLTGDPLQSGLDLIWNLDSLAGETYELPAGGNVTVRFSMATSCGAVSGTDEVRVTYAPCSDVSSENYAYGSMGIQLNPGGLTVTKSPSVVSASVGDLVSWNITVENTGLGEIRNVVITDELGPGLGYNGSSPEGTRVGQVVSWNATHEPDLKAMAPDDKVTVTLHAEVIACEGLRNDADARWGCDDGETCFDTEVEGGTATGSVQLVQENPLLSFEPPDIVIPYCSDNVTVAMNVTNTGDATASNVQINVDLEPLQISEVQGGASYEGGAFHLPDIEPDEVFTLRFNAGYSDWCAGGASGTVLYEPYYEDPCGNPWHPPVEFGWFAAGADDGAPSLSATKTGPATAYLGERISYNITVGYAGTESCGGNTTGTVTVVDSYPDVLTPVDWDGGTVNSTAQTITWTFNVSDTRSFERTVAFNVSRECDTYCGTVATNTVTASATDCCGCELLAEGSVETALECEAVGSLLSSKSVSPSPAEPCRQVRLTNTYEFGASGFDSVEFDELSFSDAADGGLAFVPGSAAVTINGTSASFNLTGGSGAGDPIEIDDIDGATAVTGSTLVIAYNMTVPAEPACGSYSFYSWSTLDLGDDHPTIECGGDGRVHRETVVVTVNPPAMSLSVEGLPTLAEKCASYNVTVTLSRTSTAIPYDVRLVIPDSPFCLVDPDEVTYTGVEPESFNVTDAGYEWRYGDRFDSGTTSTLEMPVTKRCTGDCELVATAYYDNLCTNDEDSDDTCSASESDSSPYLLSGNLLASKTPEVVYAGTDQVQWTSYVTNSGSGTAYNVTVEDVLGSGLSYNSSTVSPPDGVVQVTGTPPNGVTWTIPQMDPAETRTITLTADLISCENLTNRIDAFWGCAGDTCQSVSDSSDVLIPTSDLVSTGNVISPVDSCTNTTVTVSLRNSGQTNDYDITTNVTLPVGLEYVADSSEYKVDAGNWNPAPEPSIAGATLTWSYLEGSGGLYDVLGELPEGSIVRISFNVSALCEFAGGIIETQASYKNPCGEPQPQSMASFTLEARRPELTVEKIQVSPDSDEAVPCGASVSWNITVTNTGDISIPVVWVEDTVSDGFSEVTEVSGGGWSENRTATWELLDLEPDESITVSLTAESVGSDDPNCADLSNTVEAYWGCGPVDGEAGTKPGEDEGGCLTSDAETDTVESVRGPDLSVSGTLSPGTIDTCSGSTQVSYNITNRSANATAYEPDLCVTLPSNLAYVAGSGNVTCDGSTKDAEPDVNGQLCWMDCANLTAGQSAILRFEVESLGCFTGGTLEAELVYESCCGDQSSRSTSNDLDAEVPELSVEKLPSYATLDCYNASSTVSWNITVSNTGRAADVVRVVDELGSSLVYVWSDGTPTAGDNRTVEWEFALGSGNSTTVHLTARLDQPPDCNQARREDHVSTYWGCLNGTAEVDGDPTTSSEWACNVTGPSTSARVRVPNLKVADIIPEATCDADGSFSGEIDVVVTNAGDGATAGGFNITVVDETTGWSASVQSAGPLGASRQTTVTVPSWDVGCANCTREIHATVDPDDAVCECNEDDNWLRESYTIPIPDLVITEVVVPDTCEEATAKVTVKNEGCSGTDKDILVKVSGSLNGTATASGGLAAGATKTLDVALGDVLCGTDYTITIEVDPEDTVCECDGGNNAFEETAFSVDCPDCEIAAPEQVCRGQGDYTASATPGMRSYAWNITGGSITAGANEENITFGVADEAAEVMLEVQIVDASGCESICSRTIDAAACAIRLEKSTNGEDADAGTGPYVPAGDTVTWTYEIINSGNTTLTGIVLEDSELGALCEGEIPPLAPGVSHTCTVNGTAIENQYSNTGYVSGTPVDEQGEPLGANVTAEDPSHYYGFLACIDVEKRTNGQDADDPPGPYLVPGETVTWTYEIRNTGNTRLVEIVVEDDVLGELECVVPDLDPDESYTCSVNGTVEEGQYANTATVRGSPSREGEVIGDPVDDDDPSHYFGFIAGVDIEKLTNGVDADEAPGVYVPEGQEVVWTYVVGNTGNVRLVDVEVVDSDLGPVSCNITALEPGERVTCTVNGTAGSAPYANTSSVNATPVTEDGTDLGPPVNDEDPSHYSPERPVVPVGGEAIPVDKGRVWRWSRLPDMWAP